MSSSVLALSSGAWSKIVFFGTGFLLHPRAAHIMENEQTQVPWVGESGVSIKTPPNIKVLTDSQARSLDPSVRGPAFVAKHTCPKTVYAVFYDHQMQWSSTSTEKRRVFLKSISSMREEKVLLDVLRDEDRNIHKAVSNALLWLQSALWDLQLKQRAPRARPSVVYALLLFARYLGRDLLEGQMTMNYLRAVLWGIQVVLREDPDSLRAYPRSLGALIPCLADEPTAPRSERPLLAAGG